MHPSQWYYVLAKNREQHGPVDDEYLGTLIAMGEVQPTDYVWKTGMPDWARAETVYEISTRFEVVQCDVTPDDGASETRSDPPPEMPAMDYPVDELVIGPTLEDSLVVYAGFWRRAAALAIDGLLLGAAWAAAAGAFWLLERSRVADAAQPQHALLLTGVGFPLGALAYYVILESTRFHATVGKLFVHLTVTRSDGSPPAFAHVLARNLFKTFSFGTGLMGFILVAFTERRQALHDLLARTLVVVRTEPSQDRS